jgi:hypothetical protein
MKMILHPARLPCLNQFDATAAVPSDCFTDEPDFTPYTPRPVDPRLFDPAKAMKPFDRGFDWKSLLESPEMDDPETMRAGFEREDRRMTLGAMRPNRRNHLNRRSRLRIALDLQPPSESE